jgi:hypothetical protein
MATHIGQWKSERAAPVYMQATQVDAPNEAERTVGVFQRVRGHSVDRTRYRHSAGHGHRQRGVNGMPTTSWVPTRATGPEALVADQKTESPVLRWDGDRLRRYCGGTVIAYCLHTAVVQPELRTVCVSGQKPLKNTMGGDATSTVGSSAPGGALGCGGGPVRGQ